MTERIEYRKATEEEKKLIRELSAQGLSGAKIAKQVGFSDSYVNKIIKQTKDRLWIEHRRAIESHERSLKKLADAIDRNTRALERQTFYQKQVMARVSVGINGVAKTRNVLKNIQGRITKLIQNEEKQQTLRQSIWGKEK